MKQNVRNYLQSFFPLSPLSFRFATRIPALSGLNSICLLCLCSIFCVLFSPKTFAQTDSIPQHKQPKIGLVLSGGGAKGLAHIGVLKVIEESGIKIDYIGGTSMGAIIGGLYASGYSAHQLDSIFSTVDYDAIIRDFIPRSSKNFYEKENDERYALTLPVNKLKIGIPVSLSKGMYNYNLISRLTYHVRHIKNFDELPIPFVCVATDIEAGEEVILKSGSLAQAISASSAFPSLYSPVEIDGKYLIDGGVANNYPIEELKKTGIEIVIGVDVQDDLKDRTRLTDATKILLQISNLQMIQRMHEKRNMTDVYIKPDIRDFNVISFDQGKRIIDKGEEAGREAIEQLRKLSSGYSSEYNIKAKSEKDSLHISNISIPKLENYTRAYVIGKLRFRPDSQISLQDLKQGVENLNATQNFSSIGYTIEPKEEGNILHINLTENHQKTYLKLGLHYDGLYKSAVLLNMTRKKAFFKNDVLSGDIVLGDHFRYYLDYYIDNGFYWSFGFKSRLNRFNRNISTDFGDGSLFDQFGINSLNIDFSDLTNQVYLQTVFTQKIAIGVGAELKHLKIKSQTLENVTPLLESSDYFNLFGYLKYDSFDNKFFPKSGWYFSGDSKIFLYSSDYTEQFKEFSQFNGDIAFAKTFFKKATVILQSEGGFTIGEETVPFFNFVLGGYGFHPVNSFRHFYGYDFLSLAGNSYIKGAVTLNYEFYKKNHFNFTANYANIGNNIFENDNWFKMPDYSGYALGYGLETILGPIEIKHSWSPETKDHYTWFSVGFWF